MFSIIFLETQHLYRHDGNIHQQMSATWPSSSGIPKMLPTSRKSQLLIFPKSILCRTTWKTPPGSIHQQKNRSKSNIKPRILLPSTLFAIPLLYPIPSTATLSQPPPIFSPKVLRLLDRRSRQLKTSVAKSKERNAIQGIVLKSSLGKSIIFHCYIWREVFERRGLSSYAFWENLVTGGCFGLLRLVKLWGGPREGDLGRDLDIFVSFWQMSSTNVVLLH